MDFTIVLVFRASIRYLENPHPGHPSLRALQGEEKNREFLLGICTRLFISLFPLLPSPFRERVARSAGRGYG